MNKNRHFRGTTKKDTNDSSTRIESQNKKHRDFGSEYSPISHNDADAYSNKVQYYFMNIKRNKDIDKYFDIIQKEKNFLIKHGNIRGKHQEIYNILDRLQDAILVDKQEDKQRDIADIASSIKNRIQNQQTGTRVTRLCSRENGQYSR